MLGTAPGTPASTDPSPPLSLVEVVVRLLACLVVITLGSGYCAAYEATPDGSGHTFMVVLGFFVVPVLWLASELVGSPLIDVLQSRRWWAEADSAVHIALGVLVTLPVFAFMVATFWLFRKLFGVPGW